MSITVNKIIRAFFWFAFAAFLSASIPHVAYFFRAYEPAENAPVWWLVSYAIAISIDVTIFLLSLTIAGLQQRHRRVRLSLSVWAFTLGLVALSWYINYKYAAHFLNTGMMSATALHVPRLGAIPDINPLIASMFQVLAVAYTWIADKIAADAPEKSAADLEQEAAELERRVTAKQQIVTLKNQQKSHRLKSLIVTAKEVKAELLAAQNPAPTGMVVGVPIEPQAEAMEEVIPAVQPGETGTDTGTLVAIDSDLLSLITRYPKMAALLSGGRRTATIKEVAEATGYTEKWIQNRIDKRLLKAHSRNKKLVILASLIDWLKAGHPESLAGSEKPALHVVKEQEQSA